MLRYGAAENSTLKKEKVMKLLITLDALCFVLFATTAIQSAFRDKWVSTAIWSFGALCWVVVGVMNYMTLKPREH